MNFYLPIVLMIVGTTVYHIAQKSVPAPVNPAFSLVMNYVTALLGTLLLVPFYPRRPGDWSVRNINWASCLVGVAIVAVELGALLAYRVGWKISLASVVANVGSSLLLVAVGLLAFHEHLSFKNISGIGLCLIGLALVAQR
jgi:drug/metabolite transporter (DMT)-like permease